MYGRPYPARFAQWRAEFFGYFWLPCPLCGEMFAGFEWKNYDGKLSIIPDGTGRQGAYAGICPNCTVAGKGSYGDLAGFADGELHE